MKLTAAQLTQHLVKKNISPLYIVSGDEPLLIEETLDQIRTAAKQAGFSERERVSIESSSDWEKIFFSNAQNLSLFASKRIIELDLTDVKLNTASSKTLQEYAKQPPSHTVLLIRIHKLDSKSEKSSWYQALNSIGMMIPIWPIPIEQLPHWIIQRAKKSNLTLTTLAAQRITALVEGNLLAAAQEIEKLALLDITNTIDHDTIEKIVIDHGHFDIFNLVDSAIAGNHSRTLRILDHLAAEGIEPPLILWALTRELRTLAELATQMQQGIPLSSLFTKFRIFEKRQSGIRTFLRHTKKEHCWLLLTQAAEIDRIIKGAECGNVWDSLEQLIVRFEQSTKKLG